MWVSQTTREDLATFLRRVVAGKDVVATQLSGIGDIDPQGSELNVFWKDDPTLSRVMPLCIVIPNNTKRDFLAWTSTYMPMYRPLTRLTRVLEAKPFKSAVRRKPAHRLRELIGGAVSLVLAECAVRNRPVPERARRRFTVSNCLETLSYSLCRAMFAGSDGNEIETIALKWAKANYVAEKIKSTNEVTFILAPLGILAQISDVNFPILDNPSDLIVDAISDVFQTGDVSNKVRRDISLLLPIPDELLRATSDGTRESRMVAFESAVLALRNTSKKARPNDVGFLSGYMASTLAPGSIEYLRLIASSSSVEEGAPFWYALLAGVHPQTNVFEYDDGLGWTIATMLLEPTGISVKSIADIDYDEYEILSESDSWMTNSNWTRIASNHLLVEYLPGVESLVSTSRRGLANRDEQRQLFQADDGTTNTREILQRLNAAIRDLNAIRNEIERPRRGAGPNNGYRTKDGRKG